MRKEEFYFDSADQLTKIYAIRYVPDGEIKGILQIAHGMVEFINRYDGFAKYLCEKGILVTGNDHLGHGESVTSKENWGYFSKDNGYKNVLEDMHSLTKITKELYPNIPYFLLGHSMGSFFARYYLCEYGKELDGAIVMGTGQQTKATLTAGKGVCKAIAKVKGWKYRSDVVNNMALGSYNKKWEPSDTHCDWLTKDEEIVKWYSKEPRCQFVFTLNGYLNLFGVIGEIIKKGNLSKMPKELPVLIVSGNDDPVGNFGKDPKAVYDAFFNAGMKKTELKLYPNDRHEILNEVDKLDVYSDLYNWIVANI